MKNYKVLIIEDEPKVAAFVKKGLEAYEFEADVCKDGFSGQKMALANQYDGIILDIKLPNVNGFEICKQLRSQNLRIPILMLSALGTIEDKVKGFELGTNDYLTKPFEFQELLIRIRSLIKRFKTENAQASLLRIADLELDSHSKTVTRAGKKIALTAKEFTLFEYLLLNKGKVISKAEIAEKIWGTKLETETNVIDVYINFLRKKIDRAFSSKLIHTQFGMGYIVKEEE